MIPDVILKLVLAFIVRQISKFQKKTDWTKVKADVEIRVRKLLPGDWLDDAGVAVVHGLIDMIADMLDDEANWTELLAAINAKKWSDAIAILWNWIKDKFEG